MLEWNTSGSFFVSRAAAEHYRKQESGAFVHITSTSGLVVAS
jgi:NAD(P)-dependent dehydrogenase (short-subunit alcohol dehydrogenase family)